MEALYRLASNQYRILFTSLVQIIGPSRASIESHLSGYYYEIRSHCFKLLAVVSTGSGQTSQFKNWAVKGFARVSETLHTQITYRSDTRIDITSTRCSNLATGIYNITACCTYNRAYSVHINVCKSRDHIDVAMLQCIVVMWFTRLYICAVINASGRSAPIRSLRVLT